MENHVHLVGQQENVRDFSGFFRTVHSLFARFANHRNSRSGQFVMDRPFSPVIESDRHLLSVMAYVDLNGVRAKRDVSPNDSKWSSYKFYAFGIADDLLTPAPSYLALAEDAKRRRIEYRALVTAMLRENEILSSVGISRR
jgi:putative transposase